MAEDYSQAPDGEIEPPTGAPFAPLGICARCHRPLTRPSTAGGCLHCIVDFVGLDEDPGFASAAGSEEVRRYSHFEIVLEADGRLAELGHGSMGTTYRAQDTVLHSSVALKVIGRNVADSPSVRARFLREARTAAKLRHPNVASVFHYGEQEGECFYVMELIEGETLEERVRRDGPLSAPSVLEVGVQVARALEAAESQGLVHRDLKPSNLMLVKQQSRENDKLGETLVVKVIDFGLAKAAAADEQATGENDTRHGFVGTPAYASPEQFARDGSDARVDTRSDIYSLGVTLWYLLCGRTPFQGQSLEEIHGKQVSRALPIDQLTARRVPAPVVALLRSMLAVDPGVRPQSARELLDALQRCQKRNRHPVTGKLLHPRLAAVALLALGIVAAIIIVRGQTKPKPSTRFPESTVDRSVAVLPFDNRSPDEAVTFFTTGVQDEITGELARIAQLKVVRPGGGGNERTHPPGQRDLAAIGHELGVSHLVEGTVRREGDQVQVAIKLTDLHDKANSWEKQYAGKLSDVFAIQREVTREVANRLRATLSTGEQTDLDEPPTTDPVAYDLYLRALEAPTMFKGGAEMRRALTNEITLLDEAVARDPKFVLAYCRLAQDHDDFEYTNQDASDEERAVDHRLLAEVALEKARRVKSDAGKVHLAQAYHFFKTSHDSEQARIEVELARRSLPNDPELEQIAGQVARNQGRLEDAIRAFEKAISLQPREPTLYNDLSRIYRSLRRYADSDRASDHLVHLDIAGVFQPVWRATGPLEEKADLGPLRAALAAVKPADDTDFTLHNRFRIVYALCAHDPDEVMRAVAASKERQIRYYGLSFPKAWFEALAARMRGDGDGARVAFERAKAEMEPIVHADPGRARAVGLLAMIDAGLGRKDEAVRGGKRACELLPLTKSEEGASLVACQLAVVYAWTDQPDLAIALLEEWAVRPAAVELLYHPTYGDLRLNPVWDPLQGNPRYADLLAKLAPKVAH